MISVTYRQDFLVVHLTNVAVIQVGEAAQLEPMRNLNGSEDIVEVRLECNGEVSICDVVHV